MVEIADTKQKQKKEKCRVVQSSAEGMLPLRYFDTNMFLLQPHTSNTYLIKNQFAKGHLTKIAYEFEIGKYECVSPTIEEYKIAGPYETASPKLKQRVKDGIACVAKYEGVDYICLMNKNTLINKAVSGFDFDTMTVYVESKNQTKGILNLNREDIKKLKRYSRKGNVLFEKYNNLLDMAIADKYYGLIQTDTGQYHINPKSKFDIQLMLLSKENLYLYELMKWIISCLENSDSETVSFVEKNIEV